MHTGARYGILGGTFDPPHVGHLLLAQEVFARLALDRVWFVPTGTPPHKSEGAHTPAAQRLAMVELAIAADERFALSSLEISRPGPSYTVETLRALRAAWGPTVVVSFVLGWDMLLNLPQWHDAPGVLASLDRLVAAHRPGFAADAATLEALEAQLPGLRDKLTLLPLPQLDVSATMLRERVALGLPIRYLVPDAVARYIAEHGLYQTAHVDVPSASPSEREEEVGA